MDPSWEREVPMQVNNQVDVVHANCTQQSYVIHEERKVPSQASQRPLGVGGHTAEVVEVLSRRVEVLHVPSTSNRSPSRSPSLWHNG